MIEYTLYKSRRKTLTLSVNGKLEVIVKAPNFMSKKSIDTFVQKNENWISKNIEKTRIRNNNRKKNTLTEEQIAELKREAKEILPERTEYFSKIMNLYPKEVKITSAKKRWGSCSAKNSICFTYRLMLLPERLYDYIIVHELAHIKEKNHGRRFYILIEQILPDYKKRIREIRKFEAEN